MQRYQPLAHYHIVLNRLTSSVIDEDALGDLIFEGFENDNILSSKTYTVTKSGISPQRKLGSLRNIKLKFTRYDLTTKFFFVKIRARTRVYEL